MEKDQNRMQDHTVQKKQNQPDDSALAGSVPEGIMGDLFRQMEEGKKSPETASSAPSRQLSADEVRRMLLREYRKEGAGGSKKTVGDAYAYEDLSESADAENKPDEDKAPPKSEPAPGFSPRKPEPTKKITAEPKPAKTQELPTKSMPERASVKAPQSVPERASLDKPAPKQGLENAEQPVAKISVPIEKPVVRPIEQPTVKPVVQSIPKKPAVEPAAAAPVAPEKIPTKIPERILEKARKKTPELFPAETVPTKNISADKIPEKAPDKIPEKAPDKIPEKTPDKIPEKAPDKPTEDIPSEISEETPKEIPEEIPEATLEAGELPGNTVEGFRSSSEFALLCPDQKDRDSARTDDSVSASYSTADYRTACAFGYDAEAKAKSGRRQGDYTLTSARKEESKKSRKYIEETEFDLRTEWMRRRRSLLSVAIFTVILLFWELLPAIPGHEIALFGVLSPTGAYAQIYLLCAWVLFLMTALFSGTGLRRGFLAFVSFRTTPGSLRILFTLLVTLFDIFSFVLLSVRPDIRTVLFHFPAAFLLLLIELGEFFALKQEICSRNVFEADKDKFTLLDDRLTEYIRNEIRSPDSPEQDPGRLFRLARGRGKTPAMHQNEEFGALPVLLSTLLGVGFAVFVSFLTRESYDMAGMLYRAFAVFLSAFFLLLPVAVVAVMRILICRASEKLALRNTALSDDKAAESYARIGSVAIESEMFFGEGSFTVIGLRAANDDLVYYAASVFSLLGGPFQNAFDSGKGKTRISGKASLCAVSERMVSAVVDEKRVELRLNDSDGAGFILSYGSTLLKEGMYRIPLAVSVDGEPAGVFFLLVQNDPAYSRFVRKLRDARKGYSIPVCHFTFLPFLNRKTLKVPGDEKTETVSLAGYDRESYVGAPGNLGGIVALDRPEDLTLPLTAAKKITRYRTFCRWLSGGMMLVGAAVLVFLSTGVLPILSYPALFSLFPLLSGLLTGLFSRYYLS